MANVRSNLFYSWVHKETGERLGWVFPSSRAARNWLKENYWRYHKHKRIDEYFATLRTEPVMKFSARYWYRDRDVWNNYTLKSGRLDYSQRKKGRSLNEWSDRAIKQDGEHWRVSFKWKGGLWNLGKFNSQQEARDALEKKLRDVGAFGGRQ